jgi:hypothetical protein
MVIGMASDGRQSRAAHTRHLLGIGRSAAQHRVLCL